MVLLMVTFIEVGGARNVCWLLVTMWLYFFDPAVAVVFCWSYLFDACVHNFIILLLSLVLLCHKCSLLVFELVISASTSEHLVPD